MSRLMCIRVHLSFPNVFISRPLYYVYNSISVTIIRMSLIEQKKVWTKVVGGIRYCCFNYLLCCRPHASQKNLMSCHLIVTRCCVCVGSDTRLLREWNGEWKIKICTCPTGRIGSQVCALTVRLSDGMRTHLFAGRPHGAV